MSFYERKSGDITIYDFLFFSHVYLSDNQYHECPNDTRSAIIYLRDKMTKKTSMRNQEKYAFLIHPGKPPKEFALFPDEDDHLKNSRRHYRSVSSSRRNVTQGISDVGHENIGFTDVSWRRL